MPVPLHKTSGFHKFSSTCYLIAVEGKNILNPKLTFTITNTALESLSKIIPISPENIQLNKAISNASKVAQGFAWFSMIEACIHVPRDSFDLIKTVSNPVLEAKHEAEKEDNIGLFMTCHNSNNTTNGKYDIDQTRLQKDLIISKVFQLAVTILWFAICLCGVTRFFVNRRILNLSKIHIFNTVSGALLMAVGSLSLIRNGFEFKRAAIKLHISRSKENKGKVVNCKEPQNIAEIVSVSSNALANICFISTGGLVLFGNVFKVMGRTYINTPLFIVSVIAALGKIFAGFCKSTKDQLKNNIFIPENDDIDSPDDSGDEPKGAEGQDEELEEIPRQPMDDDVKTVVVEDQPDRASEENPKPAQPGDTLQ